jgi:hypothetical protein
MPAKRAVLVDGHEYPSLSDAARAIGVTVTAIRAGIDRQDTVRGSAVAWAPPTPPRQPGALMPHACVSRQGVYREQPV